jgi:hypothetical protein
MYVCDMCHIPCAYEHDIRVVTVHDEYPGDDGTSPTVSVIDADGNERIVSYAYVAWHYATYCTAGRRAYLETQPGWTPEQIEHDCNETYQIHYQEKSVRCEAEEWMTRRMGFTLHVVDGQKTQESIEPFKQKEEQPQFEQVSLWDEVAS